MSLLTKKDPFEKLANLTFCLAIRLSKAEKKVKRSEVFPTLFSWFSKFPEIMQNQNGTFFARIVKFCEVINSIQLSLEVDDM